MKKYSISIFLIICWLATSFSQELQFRDFDPILKNFLLGYCDEGEREAMPDRIRALGAKVEPQVLHLVKNGVPEELLKNVQESSRTQFQQRQEWLKSGRSFGLSEEDLKAAKEESLEVFVKRQTDSFSEGFMSQTFFALGLINTPQGNKILEDTSNNPQSPYQNYAKNALKFKDEN